MEGIEKFLTSIAKNKAIMLLGVVAYVGFVGVNMWAIRKEIKEIKAKTDKLS